MKKLALLFSGIALVFMSCSSDDDASSSDPIIGTWKFVESSRNGVPIESEPCDTEETWIFNANGDYSELYYKEVDGECALDDSDSGTWLKSGDVYNVTVDGYTSPIEVTFEANRFYIEYSITSTGPNPSEDTYKYIYEKQ